ncbi:hypothetical protein AMK16_05870 [Streptomyces sp. CB00455]|uniref:hypothetical protein n=1 Tax=Streptomyces sp. CB00455 TaxID=1703927 RepID=UPI00093D8E12|nr:hypothetical protein [Streptomyces sp. CB00455]OKK22613.1 hypothetical protein AMK16_05870 [Streptomyces sp. CB00455]
MRPISRTAWGTATAAVLAVTAAGPSHGTTERRRSAGEQTRRRERGSRGAARGADRSLVLGSTGGVALAADKAQAAALWADVTGTDARARSVSGGLRKLWLDGKVRASLDRSTKQVNAPAAWAAGFDGKATKFARRRA